MFCSFCRTSATIVVTVCVISVPVDRGTLAISVGFVQNQRYETVTFLSSP